MNESPTSSLSNSKTASSTVNSTPVLKKENSVLSSTSDKKSTAVEDEEMTLAKSIFIKNVDYSTNKRDLEDHFKDCGPIARCKIATDKISGQPLGYAYIEFATIEGA